VSDCIEAKRERWKEKVKIVFVRNGEETKGQSLGGLAARKPLELVDLVILLL
jgi:hypothetical protein